MNIWGKIIKDKLHFINPIQHYMVGKTIIHFTTHGCQGLIHEFDYIGIIVDLTYPKNLGDKTFYKVLILKDICGENIENLQQRYSEVPSENLQYSGGDFFIAYD